MKTTRWLVLLFVLTTAGCAAFRPGPREPESVIPIRVENDLTSRSDVTVRIVATTGASRLLGGIPPGGERVLEYRERRFSGSYVLTATTGSGTVIRSRSFTLFPDAAVIWQLQLNHVQVVGSQEAGVP